MNPSSTTVRGRAPLRLGLAGGGTDVSPYSDTYGGRILNATIDKYAYAYATLIESGVEFHSPDRQTAGEADVDDIDSLLDGFGLHVAAYKRMMDEFNGGVRLPVRLSTQVDAPPGSGGRTSRSREAGRTSTPRPSAVSTTWSPVREAGSSSTRSAYAARS